MEARAPRSWSWKVVAVRLAASTALGLVFYLLLVPLSIPSAVRVVAAFVGFQVGNHYLIVKPRGATQLSARYYLSKVGVVVAVYAVLEFLL